MRLMDWIMNEWRKLLGEHDESMTSHSPRMDPVDLKIKALEGRITKAEKRATKTDAILALYEAERKGITLPKRKRRGRHT